MNFKKAVFLLATLFVLLLAGSVVALRIIFPPEELKKIALREISKQFGREVSLGDVSLSIFTGISLSEFRLSERPDFKSGTFIEAKKFSLIFSLLPLLQKKIEIESIKLEAPKVHLRRLADGKRFNFSDLLASSTAPATLPEKKTLTPTGAPIQILVTKAKIAGGEINFIDDSPEKVQAVLRSLDLSVQGSSIQNPLNVKGSSKLQVKWRDQNVEGSVGFSGVVSVADQKIKIAEIFWETEGLLKLKVQGTVQNYFHPQIETTLNISEISFARLKKLLPPEMGSKLLQSAQLEGHPKLQVQIKGGFDLAQFMQTKKREGEIALAFQADLKDANLQFDPYFHKAAGEIMGLNFAGRWQHTGASKEAFEVSRLALQTRNGSLEGSGKISGFDSDSPDFAVELKMKDFSAEDMMQLFPGRLPNKVSISGKFNLDANLIGKLSDLSAKLNLDASQTKIEIAEAFKKASSFPFGINVSAVFKNQQLLEIADLKMNYQKSEIQAQGKISNLGASSPYIDMKMKAQNLEWENVIPPQFLPKDYSLTGSGMLSADFSGTKEKFKGSGEINLQDSNISLGPSPERYFQKSSGMPMAMKFRGTWNAPNDLEVESFSLLLGKTNFSGKLTLSNFLGTKKNFSATLITDPTSLKEFSEFVPALHSFQPEGTLQTNFTLTGHFPFDALPKSDGWIALKNVGANFEGLSLRAMTGRVVLNETGVDLQELSGKISDTPFRLRASLKNLSSPAIALEAKLEKVDLSKFVSAKAASQKSSGNAAPSPQASYPKTASASVNFPPAKMTGKVTIKELLHPNFEGGNITLEWNLAGITPQLNKVSGMAKLRTFGGEVKHVGSVEKILKIINPSLSLLDFKDIGGDFSFKEGTMQIKDLWVESEQLSIATEGTVSLPEKNCELHILARYSGAALAAAVPISVSGPLDSPKIEKKNISLFSQTLQEKVFHVQPKSAEEIAEAKRMKEEKIIEKKEEQKFKEASKKEKMEEAESMAEEKKKEREELKKQKEEERLEKSREKEALKKEKEQERLERLKEREAEKVRKKEEEE